MRLRPIPRYRLPVGRARAILPERNKPQHVQRTQRDNPAQHLGLFVAYGIGGKGVGRFHRQKAKQLQQVIRHHIPQRAGLFIIAAPMLHPETLRHGDLHMVDVLAIPDRLEDPVGKPEDQNILHRLFPEIVIDPVDLPFLQDPLELVVQRPRRFQVMSERFFDDDATPCALTFDRQTILSQMRHDLSEQTGDGGHVKNIVALGTRGRIDLLQQLVQPSIGGALLEIPGQVMHALRQRLPDRSIHGRRQIVAHHPIQLLAKLRRCHLGTVQPYDGEPLRQEMAGHEIVDRRNQFSLRQVAIDPEDDHDARSAQLGEVHQRFRTHRSGRSINMGASCLIPATTATSSVGS